MKLKAIAGTCVGCLLAFQMAYAVNITIWDQDSNGTTTGWYKGPSSGDPIAENQEVEPGNVTDQVWDMEAFHWQGNTLSIVGGFDFFNGVSGAGDSRSGTDRMWTTGDIFIDVDGKHSDYNHTANAVQDINGNLGYEYAIRFDGTGYKVVPLASDVVLQTVYFDSNTPFSNPWKVKATLESETYQTLNYPQNPSTWTDSEGKHYQLDFDLSSIVGDFQDGTFFHYTMECGNDRLTGRITSVPDPASTLALLGLGLLGLGAVRRKVS